MAVAPLAANEVVDRLSQALKSRLQGGLIVQVSCQRWPWGNLFHHLMRARGLSTRLLKGPLVPFARPKQVGSRAGDEYRNSKEQRAEPGGGKNVEPAYQ